MEFSKSCYMRINSILTLTVCQYKILYLSIKTVKMTKRTTEQCLLCGQTKPKSAPKEDEEYLNGFCDACIASMKNETKRKGEIQFPYNCYVDKITVQMEKIETTLFELLDKLDGNALSTVSKKNTYQSSIDSMKDTSSPKFKSDAADLDIDSTKAKVDSKINKQVQPKPDDKEHQQTNPKPKKLSKSKFMPKVTYT